ncbi:MAG: hypothetical protein CMI06_02960 [Oceanospirillaceae bacterium]|nr:hypothetical protein [Oceanospirillaceae bacterium]
MRHPWRAQNSATVSEYENEILAEKIRVVHRNTPMILAGNLLGSAPLLIVFWHGDYSTRVILWSVLLYIMLAIRMLHYHFPGSAIVTHRETFRYGIEQVLLIFLTGCIWGIGGAILFDADNINNIAYLILTFISMIAGSMVSLSSRPVAYILFSAPLMTPMVLSMFIQDEYMYRWMGFGAAVYLFATFGFSRTIHRVIDNSIRLKYENLDLIADLQQQTDRANRASEEKSRFLASASHDLRQPLHAVSLYAEILNKKIVVRDQREDLENISQGLESLSELLEALFDVSRLDADNNVAINKQSFCIDDLLDKLERQFVIDSTLKGLSFSVDYCNCVVYSDPVLLERVLTNLLVNAVKYTSEGGIRVLFEAADQQVKLRIIDTGIGISEEDLDCIFQEFFQVHNQERDRKRGLGLGLAIVQRILKLLGHEIQVSSVLGQGTEVALLLPLSHEPLPAKPALAGSPEGYNAFAGLNIMVVDNEASIVMAMESLLSVWGSHCISFSSTSDALAAIADGFIPDFMIVDYRMPGRYDGCSFVHEVRRTLADVPALIVTGDTSDEVVSSFHRQRLDYLHKPIKPAQLRMLVARILRRHAEAQGSIAQDRMH